jgi:hypothetical protein
MVEGEYDISLFPGAAQSVKLIGRLVPLSDIKLMSDGITFKYGVMDASSFLTRAQKRTFLGYDEAADNAAISDRKRGPTEIGTTSVWDLFWGYTATDVADATEATRNFVTGEDNPGGMSTLKKVLIFSGILLLLWLVLQIAKAVK